jgi:hypothetical protein
MERYKEILIEELEEEKLKECGESGCCGKCGKRKGKDRLKDTTSVIGEEEEDYGSRSCASSSMGEECRECAVREECAIRKEEEEKDEAKVESAPRYSSIFNEKKEKDDDESDDDDSDEDDSEEDEDDSEEDEDDSDEEEEEDEKKCKKRKHKKIRKMRRERDGINEVGLGDLKNPIAMKRAELNKSKCHALSMTADETGTKCIKLGK